jgi:catechol 2,3-dioxygenase-like lactoylglutathione lyase family enzyme
MFRTRIGHAHLFVSDLARSVAFYRRYFNLAVNEEIPGQKRPFLGRRARSVSRPQSGHS